MKFMLHFQVVILARKLSDITGNMGASEALLVELLLTFYFNLLIIEQKIIFTLRFQNIRF